jgi:hypothetical protein
MLLSVSIERYIIEVEAVSVNLCPSLHVRDQVAYPHKITGEMMDLYILNISKY